MADKVVIEAEVKSNVGQIGKDAAAAAGEFKVMGVSLNSVKASFVSAGRQAKIMFGSIKAGIMSTGIGALLIAFTSLLSFFTKTKKGAELLEVAFAGVGAAVNVIVDRVSKLGGAIVKLFQGDARGALKDVKGAFTDIGTEIANDTREAIKLKQAFVELRDAERSLNVETAQRRAQIERLKLIAEDTTKSEQERLKAAKDAFNIENNLLDRRIANSQEALRIQREEMETRKVDGENIAADLDREAELQINLANIIAESTTKQIELNNKVNAIKAEILAKRKEEEVIIQEMPKIVEETSEVLIQADNSVLENIVTNSEKQKKNDKILADGKKKIALQGLALIRATADEGSTIGKAAAIADVTQTGVQAVQNAFNTALESPITKLLPAYPFIQAGLAGAFSALQLRKIMSDQPASAGRGGGGGGGQVAPTTPAPQMMSGAFELGAGIEPEPTRAFVVTDEMTNSQNQLANIRRRATI